MATQIAVRMDPGFERVYAIREWYDGPRDGAADYHGLPHRYRSLYLDTERWDPDEDRFELTPLPAHLLPWMIEADAIWHRYLAALKNGTAPTLPPEAPAVLPEDRERSDFLERQIESGLAGLQPTLVVRGEFDLEESVVRWRPVE